MPTPHNEANKKDIARIVLMSGDPLRAKYIAEHYLKDVICFNQVRGMLGFSGTYKGVRISVMGSGMGMPSIGIYSYELFKFYDVDVIIRIGSAGSYRKDIKVYDVILAQAAFSESSYARVQSGELSDTLKASESVNQLIAQCAKYEGITLKQGIIHSSDVFYREDKSDYWEGLAAQKQCLAVEMESFALFNNAKVCGKKAACLLTISDSLVSKEETSAKEREQSFTTMMHLALESAIKL